MLQPDNPFHARRTAKLVIFQIILIILWFPIMQSNGSDVHPVTGTVKLYLMKLEDIINQKITNINIILNPRILSHK